jgi:hypothetical protein
MDYLDFELLQDLFVDSTMTSDIKQVFCNMIIPSITDPLTKCYFYNTSANSASPKNITIQASTVTMNDLSTLSQLDISTAMIVPKRKFLDVATYQIYRTVNVTVLKEHVKQIVVVTSPSISSSTSDYKLEYMVLESIGMGEEFDWTVTDCSISGAVDSARMASMNNDLTQSNSSTIYTSNLMNQMSIDVQVSVRFSPNFTQNASLTLKFSSSTRDLTYLGARSRKIVPSQSMSLLFSYSGTSFNQSNLYVKVKHLANPTITEDIKNPQAQYYVETKRLMIKYNPQDNEAVQLIVGCSPDDVPEVLTLVRHQATDSISMRFPTEIGKSQTLPFWTNAGSDYNYQIFAFRESNKLRIMSSSLTTSTFNNNVDFNLLNADPARVPDNNEVVIVIVRFNSAEFDLLYTTSLTARGYSVYFQDTVAIGTAYRDGSTLQSSGKQLMVGAFKQNVIKTHVSNDGFSPASSITQTVVHSLNNKETSFTADFPVTNQGNKLSMESESTQTGDLAYVNTSFSCFYKNASDVLLSGNWYLKLYNEPSFSVGMTHLPSASSTKAVFEISTTVASTFNKYISYDSTQFVYHDRLHYANPVIVPVHLPSVDLYHFVEIDAILFGFTNSTKPSFSMSLFDFNAFKASTNKLQFSLDASWTPTQLPVSTFVSTLTNSLTLTSGTDLLRQLNMAAFVCNHAYLACKYSITCLDQDKPVRELRGTLWSQFNNFWSTVSDKDGYQDWTSSVLKNSFINAVTLNADGLTDATIDSIDQELFREVNSMISRVSSSTTGLSRISYKLGENMKPILTVNFQNLELLLSSFSHDLRLFGYFYTGLTTQESYQTKINDIYVKLIAVNEVKLLRYTMTSDTTLFENELVVVGGATILSPIDGNNYFFSFGDSLAVELKNLTFNVTKVSPFNLRIPTKCQS